MATSRVKSLKFGSKKKNAYTFSNSVSAGSYTATSKEAVNYELPTGYIPVISGFVSPNSAIHYQLIQGGGEATGTDSVNAKIAYYRNNGSGTASGNFYISFNFIDSSFVTEEST